MIFGKLLKTGSVALTGVLIGGMVTYSSQKPEIVEGVNKIAQAGVAAKNEVVSLEQTKGNLEQDITNLKLSIKEKEAEVEKLGQDITSLTTQRNELAEEKTKLEAQAGLDTVRIQELGGKIKDLDDKIIEAQNKLDAANLDVKNLNIQLEAKDNTIKDLEKTIEWKDIAIQDVYENWGREVKKLNGKIDGYIASIDKKEGEITALKAQLDNLELTKAENETLKGEITRLENEKAELVNAVDAEKAEVARIQAVLNEKDAEITGLTADLDNKTRLIDELYNNWGKTFNDANSRVEQANQDQDEIMKAIESAKDQLELN